MAQVNHYYPPKVGVGENRKSTAVWINRIIERLHPWAAVRFCAVEENRIEFQAGPHLYNLDLERNQITQNVAMDGGNPIFTPTANAERTLEELNGYRRDDSGNRTPPPEQTDADRVAIIRDVMTPGDWATLCRNADNQKKQQTSKTDPTGMYSYKPTGWTGFTKFWPLADMPPDKRVFLLTEQGTIHVGWFDSRDKRYRFVFMSNGRLDIGVGIKPRGWLPLDYMVGK